MLRLRLIRWWECWCMWRPRLIKTGSFGGCQDRDLSRPGILVDVETMTRRNWAKDVETMTFSRVLLISVLDLDFWTWTFILGLLDLDFWTRTFGLALLDLCGICMRVTLQLLGVNILLVEIKTEWPGIAKEDMGSNSRVYYLIFFFVVPF